IRTAHGAREAAAAGADDLVLGAGRHLHAVGRAGRVELAGRARRALRGGARIVDAAAAAAREAGAAAVDAHVGDAHADALHHGADLARRAAEPGARIGRALAADADVALRAHAAGHGARAVLAERAGRAHHVEARIGLAHRRRADADLSRRAALRLARVVDARAELALEARRAVHRRARIGAHGVAVVVDVAELSHRAHLLLARVGDADVHRLQADEAARARELAARARRVAVALVAHEARGAVAVGVGHAGAVGGDAVALVRHRRHLALTHDRAVHARGRAGVARRRGAGGGEHGAGQRRERRARRAADDADARIHQVGRLVGHAVAVVVDAVAHLGLRPDGLHAGEPVRSGARLGRDALVDGAARPVGVAGARLAVAGDVVVDRSVAVVVGAVAGLGLRADRARAHAEARGARARFAGGPAGGAARVRRGAARRGVALLRAVGAEADARRAGGERIARAREVIDDAVAVLIGAVANFRDRAGAAEAEQLVGVDVHRRGGARRDRIGGARAGGRVDLLAAEGLARHAVADVRAAVEAGVGQVVVGDAVAVVVAAVARLGLRHAGRVARGARAGAARAGHERRAVVDHAVAVVVLAVARLGDGAERRVGGARLRAAHLAQRIGGAHERARGEAVRAGERAVVARVGRVRIRAAGAVDQDVGERLVARAVAVVVGVVAFLDEHRRADDVGERGLDVGGAVGEARLAGAAGGGDGVERRGRRSAEREADDVDLVERARAGHRGGDEALRRGDRAGGLVAVERRIDRAVGAAFTGVEAVGHLHQHVRAAGDLRVGPAGLDGVVPGDRGARGAGERGRAVGAQLGIDHERARRGVVLGAVEPREDLRVRVGRRRIDDDEAAVALAGRVVDAAAAGALVRGRALRRARARARLGRAAGERRALPRHRAGAVGVGVADLRIGAQPGAGGALRAARAAVRQRQHVDVGARGVLFPVVRAVVAQVGQRAAHAAGAKLAVGAVELGGAAAGAAGANVRRALVGARAPVRGEAARAHRAVGSRVAHQAPLDVAGAVERVRERLLGGEHAAVLPVEARAADAGRPAAERAARDATRRHAAVPCRLVGLRVLVQQRPVAERRVVVGEVIDHRPRRVDHDHDARLDLRLRRGASADEQRRHASHEPDTDGEPHGCYSLFSDLFSSPLSPGFCGVLGSSTMWNSTRRLASRPALVLLSAIGADGP